MQVYRHLGIAENIVDRGVRISNVQLTDFQLNVLNTTNLQRFEEKYQLPNIAIHRSDLHQELLDEVGMENIVLNKEFVSLDKKSGDYAITFSDQEVVMHSIVIGADGLRSKVRQAIFGEHQLRDAKQICWRGILDFDLPVTYNNVSIEGWGRGKRFGFVKLRDNQVYWYFLINENQWKEKSSVNHYLEDCHSLVKEMIIKTPKEAIHLDKIFDLTPLKQWQQDQVCLIGDAAHATTPNLGQGACQAIEDVFVISKLLERYSLKEAIQKYPTFRYHKANSIVKTSWTLGQVAQWDKPFAIWVRNSLFSNIPLFVRYKQMDKIFELEQI